MKARVNTAWEPYPASTAMSTSGARVVIRRYDARSSRIRRRKADGGSPAAARIIRSKW
jgi:hypothetical protein